MNKPVRTRPCLTQAAADPTGKYGTGGEVPTMSSREIAGVVGLRHDNVMRAIERLANKGVVGIPRKEE